MSTNPPTKRRRHDTPSSTLSKPFKSPLRKPPSQPTPSPEKPSTPSASTSTNPTTTKEPKPHPANNPTPPSSNPTLLTLQKSHRTLQSNLSTLRTNLDTLTQAHRLETSSKDTELEVLIGKWRGVAQDAAEEVFGGARERVARMGGMKGYKERIRDRAVEEKRWEDEEGEGDTGDVVKLEEKKEEEDGKEEEEEEEFTMETMLKTLNIEPKIIGFDSAGQRWVK